MNSKPFILISLCSAMAIGACANDRVPNNDASDAPSTKQTLIVSGDCNFATCGVVPSSLSMEEQVVCESTKETSCDWSGSGNDASVSYRYCADPECPAKPTIECPAGTVFASQSCGSENNQPCAWNTTCVPPRDTTPCPQASGCNDLPLMEIGVLCKDGTVGGFACVTDGQTCRWERNCD